MLGMQVSPEEALEVVRCGGRGQLYWPADHQCHDPLSQGPCAASQLLVLDPASLTAKCGDQLQCVHSEEGVEDGDLVWDGTQCIDVGSIKYSYLGLISSVHQANKNSECGGKGERLRYSLTGEVSCQCEDGWQRQGSGGQCHQHSTQAWCPQGQLLQV